MPCSDVIHPEDGGSKVVWNVAVLPHHYTASQPSRPRLQNPLSGIKSIFITLVMNHSDWATFWTAGVQIQAGAMMRFLLFATVMSRPALGPIQPPIKWLTEALSAGYWGRCVKLTTRPHIISKLRMWGATPLLPHSSS